MTTPEATVYRIVTAEAWAEARARGVFSGSEHDARDGFIHFSTKSQLATTAERHYRAREGLWLLWVDVAELGSALRWEPSRGGDLFPHLYGELPVALVRRAEPLPLGTAGLHVFPPELA